MGLRNSKPKHSKNKKMENSVRNKNGQQMNELIEQTPEIRDSAKKSGKQNSDVEFQAKKNKSKIKCQINASAQVNDESDTDNEDSTKIKTKEKKSTTSISWRFLLCPMGICSSSDNNEEQISRMDKIIAQGNVPCVPRRNGPAPPPPDGTPPYRCRSSDNNEEQISRMDKIIAQGNVPCVPRRPAPPPPDVLD